MEEKSIACSICKKTFIQSGDLNKVNIWRSMTEATGEKPLTCSKCEKSLKRSEQSKKSDRTHTGEKPFTCSNCEKTFKTSSDLKNHEKILKAEKPFACSKCDKAFRYSGRLKIHERIHRFKTFTESSSLKIHERTHTREKPYLLIPNMTNHLKGVNNWKKKLDRTHTGEKPFACSKCDKTFQASGAMNVQLYTKG